jgi:hypothetical protein
VFVFTTQGERSKPSYALGKHLFIYKSAQHIYRDIYIYISRERERERERDMKPKVSRGREMGSFIYNSL